MVSWEWSSRKQEDSRNMARETHSVSYDGTARAERGQALFVRAEP